MPPPRYEVSVALGLALLAEIAKEVDDVPDVRVGELALDALHHRLLLRHAVHDDVEDLTIAGAVIPRRIGEIGGRILLRRHHAVTAAERTVAMAAHGSERVTPRL